MLQATHQGPQKIIHVLYRFSLYTLISCWITCISKREGNRIFFLKSTSATEKLTHIFSKNKMDASSLLKQLYLMIFYIPTHV
ncbi:hypothetical protein C1631_009640 [Chryseobacterium phosphatilyticum]|uniref:Uncharacterized protein n=1 Tax=Chryseobacterium phosphatilyticum TaxID=475075 RepID=A0A316XHF4_9FLAO|nr:hypothetical protein C1631_009640 [Chryseobacterium phosphatilyticum]